jgi:hypothetical protein
MTNHLDTLMHPLLSSGDLEGSRPRADLYQALFGHVIVVMSQELAETMAEAVVMRSLERDVSLIPCLWEPADPKARERPSDRCLPLLGKVTYSLPDIVICVNFLRGI